MPLPPLHGGPYGAFGRARSHHRDGHNPDGALLFSGRHTPRKAGAQERHDAVLHPQLSEQDTILGCACATAVAGKELLS